MPKANVKARPRAIRQEPTVRRQDLLAVTIRCLATLGAKATTGREICRQAGVSHGLLRHYFSNPANLLLETYQELCDHFIARFEDALAESPDDPWDALDRFFAVHFDADWEGTDVLGAWMAFWSLVRNNDEFAAVSADYNRRLRAILEPALERLPVSERAAKPADAIPVLSAVMDGFWLDYCLDPSRLPRERALALWRLTIRSLMG